MPSPKRWFPKSRDFNDDPEGWELTEKFGDRTIRLWDEICAILDKTENQWRASGEWLAGLSRKVRQTPATVSRAIGWMLANHWLEVGELSADGSPTVYSSPNYWKYHKMKEPKGELQGSSLPNLPNLPNLPKKNLKKKVSRNFDVFWESYPKKIGKGSAEKSFSRIKFANGLFDTVMAALEVQKHSAQWQRDNGAFIPNPATWLNQRRWEDQLTNGFDQQVELEKSEALAREKDRIWRAEHGNQDPFADLARLSRTKTYR